MRGAAPPSENGEILYAGFPSFGIIGYVYSEQAIDGAMTVANDRRIGPFDIPEEEQRQLRALFEASERPRLIRPEGAEIHLPDAFSSLFVDLLRIMQTR